VIYASFAGTPSYSACLPCCSMNLVTYVLHKKQLKRSSLIHIYRELSND
jgi:hypothetical protein